MLTVMMGLDNVRWNTNGKIRYVGDSHILNRWRRNLVRIPEYVVVEKPLTKDARGK